MILREHHGEVLAYDIRPARGRPSKDIDYITNSWLHAHRMSPEWGFPGVIEREYFHYTHKKIDQILPRCSEKGSVYMCHEADYPEAYRGYLVAEAFEDFPPVIHWMQVKKTHKRQGVATALLAQFFKDFDLGNPESLVYTFSAKDMKKKQVIETVKEMGVRLLYLPDLKSTLNEPHWEA